MAAGVSDRLWEISDIAKLVEDADAPVAKRGSHKEGGRLNDGIVPVASMLLLGNHGAMWPFKKPKSRADMAIAVMPSEIENARVKWTEFYGFMKWKEHVGLATKINTFLQPFELGLYERHPFLKEGKIMGLIIVTQGIMLSGTHTQQELEEALGCKLPSHS